MRGEGSTVRVSLFV